MKHLLLFLFLFSISIDVRAQNASVQLIHAISDTNFQTVDIWLSNTKIADNISFRQATSFISFPAVIEAKVRICDSASTDTINPLFLFTEQLVVGEKYIMVATGIADSNANYSPYKPLNFHLTSGARQLSQFTGYSDVVFFHASTDTETLSIRETRELDVELESALSYGTFSDYTELETSNYRLRLSETTHAFPMGEFDAFLASSGLEDSALTVLISGFQQPEQNSNGPALGINVVTSTGNVYSLPISHGNIQFLHNSADPELEEIDMYVNGTLALNSLDFLTASGYLTFPSGKELRLAITSDSASGSSESIYEESFVIDANSENITVLHGLNGTEFSPIEALNLSMKRSKTEADIASNCDILFFNGSTDFGAAALKEETIVNTEIFNQTAYGQFSDYASLPAANYNVDLYRTSELFASNGLNLDGYNLAGSAITLMTVGFVDTLANQNGEEFGLWFARSTSGKFTKLSAPLGVKNGSAQAPKLFPNPTSSFVEILSNQPIEELRIYNTQGQLVLRTKADSSTKRIDVHNLIPGIYIVEFLSKDSLRCDKLIVE